MDEVAKKIVLVAEDDESWLNRVVNMLETAFPDIRVLTADTKHDALRIIKDLDLALVSTDMRMPFQGDGVEIVVAAMERDIPVIALSQTPDDLPPDIASKIMAVLSKNGDSDERVQAYLRALR